MEKKRYYISVQARTIMENQGDAAYELEIDATDEDIAKLIELFEAEEDADTASFNRAYTPAVQYHHDEENDEYDRNLVQVYRTLHQLGTPETKEFIASMNLL